MMTKNKFQVIDGGKKFFKKEEELIMEKNKHFSHACSNGQIQIVNNYLSLPMYKKILPEFLNSNAGACLAARNGHLQIVEAIFTHECFKSIESIDEKKYFINEAFWFATSGSQIHIMNFLLDSDKLEFNANIDGLEKKAFFVACTKKDQNLIKYFLIDRSMSFSEVDHLNLMKDQHIDVDTKTYVQKLILSINLDQILKLDELGVTPLTNDFNNDPNKKNKLQIVKK